MAIRASGTIDWMPVGHALDVVDPVVHEVDLAVAIQLAMDGPLDRSRGRTGVILVSIALRSGGGVSRLEMSRMPSRLMCRVRGIGVAESVSTSTVERKRLEPLLVLDAEPLLLVDDHQPQVLERDVLLQDPVRADQDVDPAGSRRA